MMNKANEWVFIVNPIAGNHYAKTLVPKLESEIEKHKIKATIVLTERKCHASELAKQWKEQGAKYIVAVGGDGTLNEVASALMNCNDVVLGMIPAGTGNDFIHILGFPSRFEEKHWDIFFQCTTTQIDAGSCNGLLFFNGMGLGFDAEVAAQNYVNGTKVKAGGKNKYLWHIVKTLLFFREKRMKVISGGEKQETNCFINTVAIGRRFAGGFYLTPNAIANDGLLDVCMVEKLNLFQRFMLLPKVPKGTHISNKRVNYYQSGGLNIEFSTKVPFHIDGELFYSTNMNVEIHPKALNIIYNPEGDHYLKFEE
jgi:YegS/Rv2252/BmrU family lipid kinase